MSDRELARLEMPRDLDQKRLTTEAAAQLLGLERRQVFRLLKAYRNEGPTGLISKQRGRRSNRRKPEALRRAALVLIREWYWDFGPTLAAEKLREVHGITLGRETLRLWMIEAGLWRDRKQRRKRVHQPRARRDCVGELVQVDGCEHWWFEDRGPQYTLLVFIDDATGRLMHLQFVESESLPAFIAADYNARFAKPPTNKKDLHRPLRAGDNLDDAFARKEQRRLSQALTLQYDKVIFIVEPSEPPRAAIGKYVTVFDYPDGRLAIRYNGVELAYHTFDKVRQVDQGAIADNKHLGAVMMIRDEQLRRGPQPRRGPRRRDQRDTRLFKVG
jgi:hypothetical protein